MRLELDNTKRKEFETCPRKYYWHFEKNLISKIGSTKLRFGVTWHAMQEEYRRCIIEGISKSESIRKSLLFAHKKWEKESEGLQFEPDFRSFEFCVKLFDAYLSHYEDLDFRLISSEQVFAHPLFSCAEDEIVFTGRIDCIGEFGDRPMIVDDKTTGWYPQSLMKQLERSPQLIGYAVAAEKLLDKPIDSCLANIVYLNARTKKDGSLGEISTGFHRNIYLYSDYDKNEWKKAFLAVATRIIDCHDDFLLDINKFYQNMDSCFQYGECPYLCLCKQEVVNQSYLVNNFIVKKWDVLED